MVRERREIDRVTYLAGSEAVKKLLSHRAVQIAEDEVVRLGDADLIARLAEVAFTAVGQVLRRQVVQRRLGPEVFRQFRIEQPRRLAAPVHGTSADAVGQAGKADWVT